MLVLATAFIAACASDDADGVLAAAGLPTVVDSTGDTIVAVVRGDVPPDAMRRLVEERRIAPTEDDTSLFTEVFEFRVDARGRFWVFDQPTRSVFLFGPDGVLERRFGGRGSGPGEFANNSGMVMLPDGRLAVWDSQNARIAFFSASGDFERQWSHTSGFNTSNGLRRDTSGTLYVTRPVGEPTAEDSFWRLGLVRLGADGVWVDSLHRPVLGVVTPNYVAEQATAGGTNRSSTSVSYSARALWAWHPHGYFVSGHGGEYRIHLSRPERPVRIERFLAPVPVSADERENEEAMITANMRNTDPAWTWRGEPVPGTKAPLMSLFAARDGRIWARVAVPSEPIPEDERAVPQTPDQPVRRWRTPSVYEVFTTAGTFLGRVQLPPRTTLMEADGNLVWGLTRDSLDLPGVARYRIEPPLPPGPDG